MLCNRWAHITSLCNICFVDIDQFYIGVLNKLSMLCEEQGITFTKVNPAYTRQRCSKCGVICKTNRKGSSYKCTCGNEMDADLNAAINLSHMGVYSLYAVRNRC